MVATAPAQRVRQALDPVVGPVGLVLEHVEVTRAGSRSVVRVVVDLAEDATGELDLDRVAEVSRVVSDALDAADAIPGHYTLEVSTPGVDRPMTQRRHFVRAIGRTVHLERLEGAPVQGRLQAVQQEGGADVLVLVPQVERGKGRRPVTGAPVSVPLTQVRVGHVQVDLSGLGPVEDHEIAEDHEDQDVPQGHGQDAAGHAPAHDDHTDEHGTGAAGQES
ncbi:ribosome maturation factor RimP [Cellulomonas soli]|uniref:ribosome maturation factor RimP n=1 Tax=Cellulomonas soli TaxID=931535 RepID=UPI003F8560EB